MDKFIDIFEKIILIIGLATCIIVLLMSIVLRSLGSPSNWAEEMIRYLMVWITFIGASRCYSDNSHYNIDLFKNLSNESIKNKLTIFSNILIIVFYIFLIYFGIQFILFTYKSKQITASMRAPIWVVYLCVPISGLTSLFYLYKNMKNIKREEF